jgi:glucose/arabinose dehydrogenase
VGSAESEQGLLGMAFEPNDPKTFYVNYTNQQGDTIIARYKVMPNEADRADPNSEQIVLFVDQPFANHNAGDLAFGSDGELYIPLGDGGSGGDPNGNGQNLSRLLGKTLRLHVTGVTTYTIPAGNPFANDGDPNTRAEIWSYGWRNPWRFSFDRLTGDMYLGDVGQGRREEVDFEPKNTPGRNYAWNRCEGAIVYPPSPTPTPCPTNAGYTLPLFDYGRSDGTTVTGGYVYRGTQYPNLVGHYIFADFGNGNFWTILPDGQGGGIPTKHGALGAGNPSTFGEDAAGELYVADYGTGIIYRIKDTAPVVTPTPTSTSTLTATPTFVPTTVTLVPTAPPPTGTPRAYFPLIRRTE